jgi:hypothetical protein
MHFIQNSWFAVYSIWFLLLVLGVIGIISYIHNRPKFLRRIGVYFSITFLFATVFTFTGSRSVFVDSKQINLSELKQDREVESPSLVTNVFRMVGSMLRDKISN